MIKATLASDRSPESIKKIVMGPTPLTEDQIDSDIAMKRLVVKIHGWTETLVYLLAGYVVAFGGPNSGIGGIGDLPNWTDRFQEGAPIVFVYTLLAAFARWLYKRSMTEKFNYHKQAAEMADDPDEKQKHLALAKKYWNAIDLNAKLKEASPDAIAKIEQITR